LTLACFCLFIFISLPVWADPLLLAAASTSEGASAAIKAYGKKTGGSVTLSLAASSALARQIAEGAPAQLFLSANSRWMDYLDKKGWLVKNTRVEYLSNHLVLIAPLGQTIKPKQSAKAYLSNFSGRLAMGDPSHVPAGQYTKAALEYAGLWEQVQTKVAPTANVRLALLLVEQGECDLGIVYKTDADLSKKVQILSPIAEASPVRYSLALIKGAGKDAQSFYQFLLSPQGKQSFISLGFEP